VAVVVGALTVPRTHLHLHKSINKTKYLIILGIHKSIKTEFIIKLNGKCLLPLRSRFYDSHLLSNNVEIKIQKPVILPLLFYRYETWSLTLNYEHPPTVF